MGRSEFASDVTWERVLSIWWAFLWRAVIYSTLLRWRWVLLVVGTLFASALAYLFVAGMFGLSAGQGNW
jgi:hypothetical protein